MVNLNCDDAGRHEPRRSLRLGAFAAILVPLLSSATTTCADAQSDIDLRRAPPDDGEHLTPDQRDQATDRIAQLVEDHYVFKAVAHDVASQLRIWKTDPALLRASDRRSFASILTERLRKVDRHFSVDWAAPLPSGQSAAAPDSHAQRSAHDNYGFEAVEHLPGNVGLVRMSRFAGFDTTVTGDRLPTARAAGEAALTLLQNSDAVIFDLRQNHGGAPAMIDLLLSGFFGDRPVLLNRFYEREGDRTTDFTTLANFSGRRRPDVPVFVLISGGTASAAEEFAYDVKTQKRGVIVGEPSFGGADPGEDFEAGGGFTVFISTGAAINPITRTNWEGIGVQPDVAVPAEQALSRAHALALQAIIAHGGPEESQTEARWALERLRAEREGRQVAPLAKGGFVGTYAGNYGDRRIGIENGDLTYRNGRLPPLKLVPVNDDTFGVDGKPETRIRFARDSEGRVITMVIMGTDASSSVYTRR